MSWEYEAAYDIVRHAMTLVGNEPAGFSASEHLRPDAEEACSRLETLKAIVYLAWTFVNEELDEMPEEAADLGLDVWQQEDKEWQKDVEAWEREHEEQDV